MFSFLSSSRLEISKIEFAPVTPLLPISFLVMLSTLDFLDELPLTLREVVEMNGSESGGLNFDDTTSTSFSLQVGTVEVSSSNSDFERRSSRYPELIDVVFALVLDLAAVAPLEPVTGPARDINFSPLFESSEYFELDPYL